MNNMSLSKLSTCISCYSYIVGWYDVPEGLVCSFPVTINPKGSWSVVQDINQTNEVKEKIKEAVKVIITYTHCSKFLKTASILQKHLF